MTPEQIKEFIQGGEWVSITPEVRPSANKTPTGEPQPVYCSRIFRYSAPDRFECTFMNYSAPNGRVLLARIASYGQYIWKGEQPIAKGASTLDYVAYHAYEVTPAHKWLPY